MSPGEQHLMNALVQQRNEALDRQAQAVAQLNVLLDDRAALQAHLDDVLAQHQPKPEASAP